MSASGTVSVKLPLASVTAPRVLSPTSVTATPASGVSDGVVDDAYDRALPGRGLAGRDQGDLAFGDGEVQPCRGEHFLQGG